MALPATCVVEVESRKTLENSGLYTIRGKRGFFLNSFPNPANPPACGFHFYGSMINRLPGNELLGPGYSYLHHITYDEKWKKYSPGKQLLKDCMERSGKREGC